MTYLEQYRPAFVAELLDLAEQAAVEEQSSTSTIGVPIQSR